MPFNYNEQNLFQCVIVISLSLGIQTIELSAPPSRLLFVSVPYYSHINALINIAYALPLHHHVTFAAFDDHEQLIRDKLEPYRSVTIFSLGSLVHIKRSYELREDESPLALLTHLMNESFVVNYKQIHDALLAHLNLYSYDMMIVDLFAYAAQDLALYFQIPMIVHSVISPRCPDSTTGWIPLGFDSVTQQKLRHSFLHRFYNYAVLPLLVSYHMRLTVIKLNQVRLTSNRTVPNYITSLLGIMQNWQDQPFLISSPLALEFRCALKPKVHHIGFVIDKRTLKHIHNNMEINTTDIWLNNTQSSEEFVVVVAFGTVTMANDRTWKTIIETLQLIPHMRLLLTVPQKEKRNRVHEWLKSVSTHPSRVLVVSWIEQQHVLAHPSVRMFITHGGINSIGEATYAHVPLLILPGFGDQFANAAKVEEARIGYVLDWRTMTGVELALRIKQIYAEHDQFVQRLIRIHQLNELEGGGAQRAARLIDGWLLVGYTHLSTLEHQLPYLVATSSDVRLTLFTLFIFVTYLLFQFMKSIVRCSTCRRRKQKQA